MDEVHVYLAAPWKHRDVARNIRDQIKDAGFVVTSRWLDVAEGSMELAQEAQNDIDDIERSDVLIVLNLGEKSEGKAWEQGYAYKAGVPVIVVGKDRLNVFQNLPSIWFVPVIQDALAIVRGMFS